MSQKKKEKLVDWSDICNDSDDGDSEIKHWDCADCNQTNLTSVYCPECGKSDAWWITFIMKVATNQNVTYGDGGYNELKWDIYYVPSLPLDDEKQIETLKKELLTIAETNNDWRENEPILNIIDPDLYVYLLYNRIQHDQKIRQQHESKIETPNIDKDYDYCNEKFIGFNNKQWYEKVHKRFKSKIADYKRYETNGRGNEEYYKKKRVESENNVSTLESFQQKGYFVRRTYQWLATEFNEINFDNEKESQIEITSTIHNISPRSDYNDLYKSIQWLFTQMLPLFNKFKIFSERKLSNFQVIVKSQRYVIDAMTGYSGHWHKEGLTENIVLAGLYYFEKDVQLKGGDLRFRNKVQPEDWYAERDYVPPLVHNVQIMEGTAVVFDNVNLVHRVRMLKNKDKDKKKRYRSFIAFFIVDPDTNIKSTKDIPCLKRDLYLSSIHSVTQLPKSVCELICIFGSCGMSLSEAKELRNKDIFMRKNTFTKGRWATGCYGNSGEKVWFPMGHCSPGKNSDLSWISSTHSELTKSSNVDDEQD